MFASVLALSRDLDLAEDAAQDAFAQALAEWPESGIPVNPGGWLATAARRRAIDAMRRRESLRRKLPLLIWDEAAVQDETQSASLPRDPRISDEASPVILDQQLRLFFLAAHPALSRESRVAVTLRLVAGVPSARIAAAFLVSESAMAARLTRAKKRIVLSRIPCRVPGAGELRGRLADVLDVLSVLLAVGQRTPTAGAGMWPEDRGGPAHVDDAGAAVLDAAVRMLEVLVGLLPEETEPHGLLAQALLLQARVATRHDGSGRPVALADQDRGRWDRGLIERADGLVMDALERGGRGPYLLHGAIAAAVSVPGRHGEVDWGEVVELYDALLRHWPTAIVGLGRIVALGEAAGPEAAFAELERLADDELGRYRPFHVVRGELLTRIGEHAAATDAYRAALGCPGDDGETDLLREMIRRPVD